MASPTLPDDILIDILTRLPFKSLYRFKCASKHFSSLIHDEIHRNWLPKTVSGLFRVDKVLINRTAWISKYVGSMEGCDGVLFPSSLSCDPDLRIITGCNGLLLLLSFLNASYYVYNPATKRLTSLPEPTRRHGYADKFVLAFDPWVSPHYKVIRFQNPPKEQVTQPIEFDVFNSTDRTWCVPKALPASSHNIRALGDGFFVGGILYLPTSYRRIVKFDLLEENYQLIKLPMVAGEKSRARGVFVGNLWFASCDGFQLKVWILQDFSTSEWALKNSISVEALEEKYPQGFRPHPICKELKVLAFHPYMEVVFLQMGLQIFSYNINSLMLDNPFNLELDILYSKACSTFETFLPAFGIFPFSPCRIDLLEDADMH